METTEDSAAGDGPPAQKSYPDSTSVEYVYDLAGKLQQVSDPTGTYGFAYDNMGRLVGGTTQYTFVRTPTPIGEPIPAPA
ncbi:MAG TPA: RHS repeat domain-containing protein [Candidatus Dormibacteraeota bacterium]|nr:RHS repeat domain-containing protein [Candidatus Dormibacteraeota bacterium]